ncbi:MAG: DNA repair protein RecO [Thermoanaerobaculaceae bacterium]|nr:DNA repair protein RecO [Thermoanaerobaculaceae bacterium]MDI9622633.1 DNA repair protein RecO [Acidobacteriota bacterium]NLH11667.1 DNA repair protein RecO [Holophagae bacterium]HPW54618.1 DNA repair protein RecO [Thermoanaerobaculaceae bacterium]
MPLHQADGVVLTRYAFQERDWVVVLLTPSAGQVRLVARRVRTVRGGVAQAVEPLSLVRVSYFERPGSELGTLREAVLRRSSFALAGRPQAWAAAQVVAELALLHCPPGQPAGEQFRLVDHCLEHLCTGGDALIVAHYAELWFLRLGGILPGPDRCGRCERPLATGPLVVDTAERLFVCSEHRPPTGTLELPDAAARWLRQALRSRLEAMASPAPPPLPAWLAGLRRQLTERDLSSLTYLHGLVGGHAVGSGR